MELTTIASVGVVLASVGYYFRDLLYHLFDSPLVAQVLNVTMGLTAREGAEIVIQAAKEIIVVVARVLHLILHIGGQALILVKSILDIVRILGNSLYIALTAANSVIQSILEFPGQMYLWITTPPSYSNFIRNILIIFVLSFLYTFVATFVKRFTKQPS